MRGYPGPIFGLNGLQFILPYNLLSSLSLEFSSSMLHELGYEYRGQGHLLALDLSKPQKNKIKIDTLISELIGINSWKTTLAK